MNIIYPPTTGRLCAVLRAAFSGAFTDVFTDAYGKPVTVGPELPKTKTLHMVTLRDDSGPDDGVQSRRRQGVNVWAPRADAELLALTAAAILRGCADGKPITRTDSFSGPYEVADDPRYVVGGTELVHFFFSFRVSVRGTDY